MSDQLIDKVKALPEIYQPIFGHPELAEKVSRQCEDRLQHIGALHDALREKLGRPVRVLDLGCAQGYICLSLAARGACVTGVDFLLANVDVCRALAAEHPELDVRFEHARLEMFIENLEENAFDLVLGLSVFHHVVHEFGIEATKQWMNRLASHVAMGVFELAQAREPLYWGPSQPEDARELLSGFPFVHELARFSTHLSDVQRPLYVASACYWYLGGEIHGFERNETDPHALARGTHQLSRHYLFGEGRLAKLVRFDGPRGDHNKAEWQREVAALSNVPEELKECWPVLESHGHGIDEGWLVRSVVDGELLLDVLHRGGTYDPDRVIGDVLEQLVILERNGRCHNDLRVWNVLLTPSGRALLIDYGAISSKPIGVSWPDDLFLAFFTFVHEVATRTVNTVAPYVVPPFISPLNLPEPYASWLMPFWSKPRQEWSFRAFLDGYAEIGEGAIATSAQGNARELWMGAVERHLAGVGHQVFHQEVRIEQLQQDGRERDVRLEQLQQDGWEQDVRLEQLQQNGLEQGLRIEQLQQDGKELHLSLRQASERQDGFERAVMSLEESLQGCLEAIGSEKNLALGRFEQLSLRLDTLEQGIDRTHGMHGQIEQLHEHWLAIDQERQRLQQQLELVYSSHSFRITRPLRYMGNFARKVRYMMGKLARPIWHRMVRHAWGRRIGMLVFYPFPGLRDRLKQPIVAHSRQVASDVPPPPQNKILSVGSSRIYEQLQQGMKSRKPSRGE